MRPKSMMALPILALLGVAAKPVAAQTENDTRRITVYGYTDFQFTYSPSDVGRGDRNGSFNAQEFDPIVIIRPTDRIRVVADFRWAHGPTTSGGTTTSPRNLGEISLEYGFAEYQFSDAFTLRGGKMLTPFGIYNELHDAAPVYLPFQAPQATNTTSSLGAERRYYERRGAGVQALGKLKLGAANADYSVMVANGADDVGNPFQRDDNTSKSVTARFRISPVAVLTLGISYYRDLLNVYDASGKDTGMRRRETALGASAVWNPGKEGIELEWLHGSLGASSPTVPKTTGNGYAALLYYNTGWKGLTPYFRAQYFDPNNDVSGNEVTVLSPGLNISVKHVLFVKLQIDRYLAGDKNSLFKGQDYTQLEAGVSVAF